MDYSLCKARIAWPVSCAHSPTRVDASQATLAGSLPRLKLLHSTGVRQSPLFFTSQQWKSSATRTEIRAVLTRCSLVCVSTFEHISGQRLQQNFFEAIPSCKDPSGVFKVVERDLSRTAGGEDGCSFDWLAQWYPVGVLKHMDRRRPHPVTVLGRDLVLWWDRSGGEWQVFANACPHRQAPLSEGRIDENGHLQCTFHGWAFAPSSGACTRIPQAPAHKNFVKDSKRACATVYQSKEQHGLLFVYMDPSEGSKERAALNPPPFIPILDDPNLVHDMSMHFHCYSYDTLVEHVLDASHLPFTHHSVIATREAGGPIEFRTRKFGKAGFWGDTDGTSDSLVFSAPCLVTGAYISRPPSSPEGTSWHRKLRDLISSKILAVDGPNMINCFFLFCVPTVPGKSRVFFAFPRNFAKIFHDWTPGWVKHLKQMSIGDADNYLLHLLEHHVEAGGGTENLDNLYYTPTTSDAYVLAYRRWLKKFGGGIPDYGPKASSRLPPSDQKARLMDRRSSHVDYCTFCSGALRNFRALEYALHVMPFVLVGLAAASIWKPLHALRSFSVPLICLGIASSVASRWLADWIRKHYEFHDYDHALIK